MADAVAAALQQIVDKASTSWLKNNEVLELLEGFTAAGLSVCQVPPEKPGGGQLFLYDRRSCRFFRKDGHTWRKKPDGKTIRETHEKLKVGNAETLNCYYAHADQDDGLQRRCYWQLDPEKEHTVLVHYLCCASARATGPQSGSAELAAELGMASGPAQRPQRASRQQQRRSYSPPPATGGRGARRAAVPGQSKLSPLVTQSSHDTGSLLSQDSDAATLPLPSMLGMSLDTAAALPSLAQQYAMRCAGGQDFVDPFETSPSDDMHRPLPGVLYTGQLMATQLAAAQQQACVASSPMPPRPHPFQQQQDSLPGDSHRNLFRQMSLGIQKDIGEEVASFLLGSPTEHSLDPMGSSGPQDAGAIKAAGVTTAAHCRGTSGGDLAAMLSSPPRAHHRRSFSRQGSGLSRLISKNWENDLHLQMEMMLPDVDADISTYPVGNGLVVDVAERPSSPSSRLVDHAGIAFFGTAGPNFMPSAMAHHTLEPSPLGVAALFPSRPDAAAAVPLPAIPAEADAGRLLLFPSPLPTAHVPAAAAVPFSCSPASLLFAGDGSLLAQRAVVKERAGRGSGGGMPRIGSHQHLARLSGGLAGSEASPEDQEQQQRRKERAEAAAREAQEHRDEKLAALRSQRAALTSNDAEDSQEMQPGFTPQDSLEMIDNPENIRRLSSFMQSSRPSMRSSAHEVAAAEAVAAADFACSLLKHMSIDEADAVAALSAPAKELDVMPTIHATGSSEVDVASAAPSLSEEVGSRTHSVSSLLEGMQMVTPRSGDMPLGAPFGIVGSGGSLPGLDPIGEQLRAAFALHESRAAGRAVR